MEQRAKMTIKDIANLANTSKTTVSFYLNGKTDKMSQETKSRIEAVIKETNYHPSVIARSLNAKSMNLIGVIIGDITNTFANQIVKGIEDVARSKNYQLIVGNSNYEFANEEQYVNRMLEMGVDGFIVQPTTKFKKLMQRIEKENKKVVFIDSQVSIDKGHWVKTNNYEAVLDATEKCIAKGYEDFVLISADPSVLSTRLERTLGFTDALALKDIPFVSKIVESEVQPNEILEFISQNIKLDRKTLIFAANCWLLPIVYVALKKYRNLMPHTIGLIGFDNLEWTNFSSPSVTTIVQPAYDEGAHAVRILIDSILNENQELPNQILKCEVNWCESTAIDE